MAEKTTKKSVKKADVVMSLDDLKQTLAAARTDLLATRRSHAAGELQNPKVIGDMRKNIARLLTQINQKESK